MSNVTGDHAASFSSSGNSHHHAAGHGEEVLLQNHFHGHSPSSTTTHSSGSPPLLIPPKKRRNQPGNPDPNAEVIALSPNSLMATNRFLCEVCHKGFQRDQNLQLHRRGHNLPWKLKVRPSNAVIRKKVYVCPEPSCVHHNPARALGDLTGIKKHFCRKHGEKKFKCEKCTKSYAVYSDWKAHIKICGTKEYKCDCGTLFNRKDSFVTHRAFCDALVEENQRASNLELMANLVSSLPINSNGGNCNHEEGDMPENSSAQEVLENTNNNVNVNVSIPPEQVQQVPLNMAAATATATAAGSMFSTSSAAAVGGLFGAASLSATAMLQKAAQMGATGMNSPLMMTNKSSSSSSSSFMTSSIQMQQQQQQQPERSTDYQHLGGGGLVSLLLKKQQRPPSSPTYMEFPSSNSFLQECPPSDNIGGFQKYNHHLDQYSYYPFMKNYDHQDENNVNLINHNNMTTTKSGTSHVLHGATTTNIPDSSNSCFLPNSGLPSTSRYATADRTTVDFLGIGGGAGVPSRPRSVSLHDHMDIKFNGGISHPMMQAFKQYQSHNAPIMDHKPLWKV